MLGLMLGRDRMKRLLNKLSAQTVKNATKPGRYADGGNLYLLVDHSGAKRWLFIFRWQGKQREMGLGSLRDVTLAQARERATAARASAERRQESYRGEIDQRRPANTHLRRLCR